LRIKEDKVAAGATKNSVITPTLGAGITFALQTFSGAGSNLLQSKNNNKANGNWNRF
jgi:hypothetical protein